MSTSTLGLFRRHLALSEEVRRLGTTNDHNLLATYEAERGQAAFTELMRRRRTSGGLGQEAVTTATRTKRSTPNGGAPAAPRGPQHASAVAQAATTPGAQPVVWRR